MLHANDNQYPALARAAAAHEAAVALVASREAQDSEAIERLADELIEGRLDDCRSPEFGIAIIDELREMAGARRAEETGRPFIPSEFLAPWEALELRQAFDPLPAPLDHDLQVSAPVAVAPRPAWRARGARPKVCFLFIAQQHQILHSVSLAAELSRSGRFDVHVAAVTDRHLDYVRALIARLGGGEVVYHRLWPKALPSLSRSSIPPKAVALALNLPLLRQFDAFVAPERSSLMLKRMGLRRQVFIHTDHGAGDRAVGYEPRIAEFDLVLLAGEKQRRRMSEAGLIRDGSYAIVGYPKFDVVDVLPPRPQPLFPQARPTVLYNPHFHAKLGSWDRFGEAVLEQFAASPDYNLIFAPHVRLFDGAAAAARALMARFAESPNIHFDFDGDGAWDMTYTNLADVYLGDVSSQVYEFIRRPRPCAFLNAQGVAWQADDNYAHWNLGPVLHHAGDICGQVDEARRLHARFLKPQRAAFAETFDLSGSSSKRAAAAVAAYLGSALGQPTLDALALGPA